MVDIFCQNAYVISGKDWLDERAKSSTRNTAASSQKIVSTNE